MTVANSVQCILGAILIISSVGVITVRKPVYASLCFLLSLVALASLYLELAAPFIAVMQILVYAGAILVIFMFVIVLFQDAHQQIEKMSSLTKPFLLWIGGVALMAAFIFFAYQISNPVLISPKLPVGYGSVDMLGEALFVEFFFPFEAVILLFLVAVIGAHYIGKKERK